MTARADFNIYIQARLGRHRLANEGVEMNDAAFLAPFRAMYAEAREIEASGELFMRAAFQVRDPADAEALRTVAEKCFQEGRRIRESVPTPDDAALAEGAKT